MARDACDLSVKPVDLPLEGSRIRLRPWQENDLEPWLAWMKPGHRWKEMDGPYYPLPTEREMARMLDQRRREIEHGPSSFPPHSLVIAGQQCDVLIGIVTWHWESEETHWPAAGIVIYDETQWGRGLGYEALGLWTDFLFRVLPRIVRMDLRTWSGNRGMMRLAEKLGYAEEARFRRARIIKDRYFDGLGYGVLREEWMQRYPKGFSALAR